MWDPGIPEAMTKFNNRFEDPFLKNLYETQYSSLPETEVNRYVHTGAFREWCTADRTMIVCTTSIEVDYPPCALGACITKYVADQTQCRVIYIDCYWILQTPQQAKQKSLANNLLRSELKHTSANADGLVELVLESMYCQLFRTCQRQEYTLESYYASLSGSNAVFFQSQISESGIPPQEHLWSLIKHLLQSTATKVLICLDRIHELDEGSRARLMPLLSSLKSLPRASKLLLCGNGRDIDQAGLLGTPMISEETETKG